MSKSFPFFERELVKDSVIDHLEITCCACGRGHLVFGDNDGCIRIFDQNFNVDAFPAYRGVVTHLKQLQSCNVLASVGFDSVDSWVFKLWDLDLFDKTGQKTQKLLRSVKLSSSKWSTPVSALPLQLNLNSTLPVVFKGNDLTEEAIAASPSSVNGASLLSPIVCFDVAEDLTYAAIGLTNGEVVLMKGNLRKYSPKLVILQHQQKGSQQQQEVVSYVGFKRLLPSQTDYSLFVVTTHTTLRWKLTQKAEEVEVLAEIGALPQCVSPCESVGIDSDIAVVNSDYISFYADNISGPGPCSYFAGNKRKLAVFKSYLIVVFQQEGKPDTFTLAIHDLRNKLQGFSADFKNIAYVLTNWSSIFIITNNGSPDGTIRQQMFRLEEKETQTKLEMLYKKKMYSVAVSLAKSQQFGTAYISDIYKKYGDHLYEKGDYEQAVKQYIKTVLTLEPSYVIRKFLDAQRIHNLADYLEELHSHGIANADHTTLLLNCYTKLKDRKKLAKFIHDPTLSHHYDVETAIKVCRQADYYEHALHLATKHEEHNWCLKIQIEDLHNYQQALEYITGLDLSPAVDFLQIYGKISVSKLPDETTKVLMDICTAWCPVKKQTNDIPSSSSSPNPLLSTSSSSPPNFASSSPAVQGRSKPEYFIKAFVDAPYYLMCFLECVLKNKLLVGSEGGVVWNTLLELYLIKRLKKCVCDPNEDFDAASYNPDDDEEWSEELELDYKERRAKALHILQDPEARFDPVHALVLVQTHDFHEGILNLYEKLYSYNEIVRYYMQINDYVNVISSCRRFGSRDPNMWVQVLTFFVQSTERDFTTEINEVLQHIERENLLTPLDVVQIMSKSEHSKLDIIKGFISRRLEKEMQMIAEDQNRIKAYKEETSKLKDELVRLQIEAQTFQQSKCSLCKNPLDLPTVHYLCKHSFHLRCSGETRECPLCVVEMKKVMDMKRSMDDAVDQHQNFFQ